MIAGAGLAADGDRGTALGRQRALEPPRGAVLDDVDQRAPHDVGELFGQQPLALGRARREMRLVRRVAREHQRPDSRSRQAHAAVDDDAHQLGERRGAVARRADRGRVRRGQRFERVAEPPPRAVDLLERLDLEQAADALVLRVLVARAEEPGVDLLPLRLAGRQRVRQRGAGPGAQEAHEPQFERVHPRDVAAIGQRHPVRGIAFVQRLDGLSGDRAAWKSPFEECSQRGGVAGRLQAVEDAGEPRRRRAHALHQQLLGRLGGLPLVLAIEAREKAAALAVGEAGQVFAPKRVGGVLEQRRARGGRVEHVVVGDVAHHPDEHQVHRVPERLAHRHHPAVVARVEVLEVVQAAAGEEPLGRIGRIAPLHRRFEHRAEPAVGGLRQVLLRPAGEGVALGDAHRRELVAREPGPALVQRRDDLQVGDQRAQLRGRAQVESRAFVDVQRLVVVVGLHAQQVRAARALEQREADGEPARVVALAQQAEPVEAGGPGAFGIGQAAQHPRDLFLGPAVERARRAQVEAVEFVGARNAEQAGESRTHRGGRLSFDERDRRHLHALRLQRQAKRQRGIAKARVDDTRVGEQPQVGVGEVGQLGLSAAEVPGGPSLRNHQRQRLLERERLRLQRLVGRLAVDGGAERAVDLVELAAVPGPEPVADAVDFAETGARGQRHRVQVVDDNPAPARRRVRSVEVGAQRSRGHLPQLLLARRGAALGRMPVFLDLRGERAAAVRRMRVVDQVPELVEGCERQPVPFDGRVARRVLGVEQLAVLDEQQRLHQQRGHRVEIRIGALRKARGEDGLVAAIAQLEPGLALLVVGREQAAVDELDHPRRHSRLRGDLEALLREPLDRPGQLVVAEPLVVGARPREADRTARAGLDLEPRLAREVADPLGLQARRADLDGDPPDRRAERGNRQRPQQEPEDPSPAATGRDGRFGQGSADLNDAARRPSSRGPSARGADGAAPARCSPTAASCPRKRDRRRP